jgi:hypothetical protein
LQNTQTSRKSDEAKMEKKSQIAGFILTSSLNKFTENKERKHSVSILLLGGIASRTAWGLYCFESLIMPF